jgi:hypothetical protein
LGYNGGGDLRQLPFADAAAAVPTVALPHVSFGHRHQALADVGLELQVGKAILAPAISPSRDIHKVKR